MKCRICARECPPGAKICRDCAAARKRAFAATVTQPLLATAGAPSVGQPRFAPRPARPAPARRRPPSPSERSEAAMAASAAEGTAVPGRLSLKWLFVGVALATTIVFLVIKILASGSHAADAIAAADDATGETVVSVAAPNPLPAIAAPRDPVQNLRAPTDAFVASPDARIDARAGPKNSAPKAGARRAAAKAEAARSASSEPPAVPKVEPVAAAPRSAPARVAEAPRDPWQAMNEGLSRCGREDFLSRFACEQRLRLQYCPNHWGQVPQCAIGPATDHGQ